jgi:hypothetical protein
MQFLDIYWTKNSNLLIYAIHSLSQWCKSMIFWCPFGSESGSSVYEGRKPETGTTISQKTRVFCSMLFTVISTGEFQKTTVYSEMQFLDIYWTKYSNLLIYAIHSLSQWCKSMIFGVDPDPDPRNRIRGSMPLTNGSGFGSGSVYFHHWPSRCQQKLNFLGVFSEYYFLTVLLNHLSKVKSQKEVTNQYIKGLSYYFC